LEWQAASSWLAGMPEPGAARSDKSPPDAFPSALGAARRAAERAAQEQTPSARTDISYEDGDGRWHDERSSGSDRPETDVEG